MSRAARAKLLRLHRRKSREREGLVLVEGTRACSEALAAGADVRIAAWSNRLLRDEGGAELARRLAESAAQAAQLDDRAMAELSATEATQGVLLAARQPEAELEGLLARDGVALVLDAVQDPGNVGTLLRSAHAFGAAGVVCLDGTVDPWGVKCVRASAGSVFHIPVVQCTADDLVRSLESAARPIWVADARAGLEHLNAKREQGRNCALVVGNEGKGPRHDWTEKAAARVGIALPGGAESLNVGVAASILLYELTKESE